MSSTRTLVLLAGVLVVAGTGCPGRASRPAAPAPVVLIHAHAHNDYEHRRPLLDALAHGFCSFEADVWLVNGRLLVAHDLEDVHPDRTLERLYLDPLRARVRTNGGRVHPGGPECDLLVDVKSEAASTYRALRAVLERYADLLTTVHGRTVTHRAVLVVVSGNEARSLVAADQLRYAALDGRLPDLRSDEPPDLVPWISADWEEVFGWRGRGTFPRHEEEMLRRIVDEAHAAGRRVRFWNAPDGEAGWRVLLDADVDLISTDNLTGLERFLSAGGLDGPPSGASAR